MTTASDENIFSSRSMEFFTITAPIDLTNQAAPPALVKNRVHFERLALYRPAPRPGYKAALLDRRGNAANPHARCADKAATPDRATAHRQSRHRDAGAPVTQSSVVAVMRSFRHSNSSIPAIDRPCQDGI